MEEKIKLFLDFDGTIVNSVKAYCKVNNILFNENADHTKVNRWDLSDECPNATDIVEAIFASDDFFEYLEDMDEDTINIINQLKEIYDVIICTIGTPKNISKKAIWIEDNLGIKDMILLSQENAEMNKSIVDMTGSIIIDDHENNLFSSNAAIKICYGEIKSWNENWNGLRAMTWNDVGKILL